MKTSSAGGGFGCMTLGGGNGDHLAQKDLLGQCGSFSTQQIYPRYSNNLLNKNGGGALSTD